MVSIGEAPGLAAIGLGLILLATMIALPGGLSGGREAGELGWLGGGRSAPAPAPTSRDAPGGEARERSARGRRPARGEGVSVAFAGLRVLRRGRSGAQTR